MNCRHGGGRVLQFKRESPTTTNRATDGRRISQRLRCGASDLHDRNSSSAEVDGFHGTVAG